MNVATIEAPLAIAIAEGATTPSAPEGTSVWSTLALKTLTFVSGQWAAPASLPGGPSVIATATPLDVVEPGGAAVLGASQLLAREDHNHVVPVASAAQGGVVAANEFLYWPMINSTLQPRLRIARDSVVLPRSVSEWFFASLDVAERSLLFLQLPNQSFYRTWSHAMQHANWQTQSHAWDALGRAASAWTWGLATPMVVTGSLTARATLSTTTLVESSLRVGLTTAATPSAASVRAGAATVHYGASATTVVDYCPSFLMVARMNLVQLSASHRFFVGLTPIAVLGNMNVLDNGYVVYGFGCDMGDTALSIFCGTQKYATAVADYRAAFALPGIVEFYIGHNFYNSGTDNTSKRMGFSCRYLTDTTETWLVQNQVISHTGAVQNLGPNVWISNGATATTSDSWDIHQIYLETDW